MKTLAMLMFLVFQGINTGMAQSFKGSIALPYITANAYSNSNVEVFSFTANQAALTGIRKPGLAVYGEQRFGLAAAASYALAAVYPTTTGNFGVVINHSGSGDFSENKVGLAYGRKLGKEIAIGLQFDYYGYRIPGYRGGNDLTTELGVLFRLSPQLCTGIALYDPVGTSTGGADLPFIYRMGLGYDVSHAVFICGEITKETEHPATLTAVIAYQFSGRFFAKAGITGDEHFPFAGFAVNWNGLRLDLSGSYHPQLGFSPGILLSTAVNGKNE